MADVVVPHASSSRTLFKSIVAGYIETGRNGNLKILVVGEAGQGKSTLINSLVGSEVAKEGDQFTSGTVSVEKYNIDQNGVHITIWDTPGFGMESLEEDEKIVKDLKTCGCKDVDLALFCVRMDSTRFPTRLHHNTISKLHEVFGRKFWRHCLFVLTFANNIEQFCPCEEDVIEYFLQRHAQLENKIRDTLKKDVELSDDILTRIHAVPVGFHKATQYRQNPWTLPNCDDWFVRFWMVCTDYLRSSALSALLQANYHRFEKTDGYNLEFSTVSGKPDVVEIPKGAATKSKSTFISQFENFTPQCETSEHSSASLLFGENRLPTKVFSVIPKKTTIKKTLSLQSSESQPSKTQRSLSSPVEMTKKGNTSSHNLLGVSHSLGGGTMIDSGVHEREIPLYNTLERQLNKERSGFADYVSDFLNKKGFQVSAFKRLIVLLRSFLVSRSKIENDPESFQMEAMNTSQSNTPQKSSNTSCTFTVDGTEAKKFDWQDKGMIIIDVPVGVVPTGSQCDITVSLIPQRDRAVFPKNCVSVSEIFEVTTSCDLQRPIGITLRHCVSLSKPEHEDRLTFAKAHSGRSDEKIVFEELNRGDFNMKSQYGVLACTEFSCFTVLYHWLLGYDPSPPPLQCSVYMLHSPVDSKLHIIISKNIKTISEHAISSLSDDFKKVLSESIVLVDEELLVMADERTTDGMWLIQPIKRPCKITRKAIEDFCVNQDIPPKLSFNLTSNKQSPSSLSLTHEFKFQGTVEGEVSLMLICNSISENEDRNLHVCAGNNLSEVKQLRQHMKRTVESVYSKIHSVFATEHTISLLAQYMVENQLLTINDVRNATCDNLMTTFVSHLDCDQTVFELDEHFSKFINAVHSVGGPSIKLAGLLREKLHREETTFNSEEA